MGLKQNNFRDTMGSFRCFGLTQSNNANPSNLTANTHLAGAQRNFTAGQGCANQQAGIPYGYRQGGAWVMPMKSGGVSSFNALNGSGTISADLLAVKLFEASLSGSGDVTALGSLIVQAIAALSGSGEISDAQVNAFLAAVANISGSGEISDADIEGLGEAVAAIFGSGALTGSMATGVAEAIASLTVTGTGLSTANVGSAVWSALATANNVSGTMGEKLNDAGGAANPWTEVIESGFTASEIMKILLAVAAGDATGLNGSAVIFKSQDGAINRIEATQVDGNRTIDVIDVS